LRNTKKKDQKREGLGRSCGGFSTKIHAACDALGNPLCFTITPGQDHDSTQAIPIISKLKADFLLADKGYDSDSIRQAALEQGMMPNIPSRINRIKKPEHDSHLYKERHKIE